MNGREYLLSELDAKNKLIFSLMEKQEAMNGWSVRAEQRMQEMNKYLTDRQRKLVDEALANKAAPPSP